MKVDVIDREVKFQSIEIKLVIESMDELNEMWHRLSTNHLIISKNIDAKEGNIPFPPETVTNRLWRIINKEVSRWLS